VVARPGGFAAAKLCEYGRSTVASLALAGLDLAALRADAIVVS
jgi:hypothetical protein